MTTHYPIVFEREASGAISAFVVGLPVYAQAATWRQAERAIAATLAAYVEAFPTPPSAARPAVVKVAAVTPRRNRAPAVALRSAAALLGQRTSRRKAASSRANGRLGGRPRKAEEHP